MSNPLIAMIGISEYDSDVNLSLDCVINDYKNVQHAFYVVRGCCMAYFNSKNTLVHKIVEKQTSNINSKNNTNSRNVSNRHNLKLRWNEKEIFDYNNKIHEILENKQYNYDGLIYFISCHGDRGSVIYDSNGNKVPLIAIFDKFNNQNCLQLRNKPKIYFIEACRGDQRTKRMKNSLFIENKESVHVPIKVSESVTDLVSTPAPSPPPQHPPHESLIKVDENNGKDEFKDIDTDFKVKDNTNDNVGTTTVTTSGMVRQSLTIQKVVW